MKQALFIIGLLQCLVLHSQTTIWCEDFESYGTHPAQTGADNNLPAGNDWTSTATDCDDGPAAMGAMNVSGQVYWGTEGTGDQEFRINDIEGTCCGIGGACFGNSLTTETMDITGYTNVTITVDYRSTGTMEIGSGSACNNADDAMDFAYDLDGAGFVAFFTLDGSGTGTATIAGLSGTSLVVRIRGGNKANAENYFFDDICVVGSATLPIALTGFTAELYNTQVELNWITATELNNDYFEVQRSADGQQFETIEYVSGSGTTTTTHVYHTRDPFPLNGVSYYRLKQVDFNGTPSFSGIEVIDFNHEHLALNGFLSNDEFMFRVNIKETGTLSLLDCSGRLCSEITVSEPGTYSLGTNELNPGLYIALLSTGDQSITQKVIIP